jgi:hypothetical protein
VICTAAGLYHYYAHFLISVTRDLNLFKFDLRRLRDSTSLCGLRNQFLDFALVCLRIL